jgi:FixJ family two-component response regulator
VTAALVFYKVSVIQPAAQKPMKKTIVLLDDDMGVRLAIARALAFAGFQVVPFSSGHCRVA